LADCFAWSMVFSYVCTQEQGCAECSPGLK